MIKKTAVLLLGIIVLFSGIAHSAFGEADEVPFDRLRFENIGRDQGLLNLSVSSVIQDKQGFIWFATQGGLFRYNGKDTIAYRNNPFESDGLIHNLIQTMFYDEEKHHLWLGTYQGVSMLDLNTNTFTNYSVEESNLSNNVAVAIAKDKDDRIWVGTLDGLNRLDQASGSFVQYSVKGKVVRSLFLDSQDRLLVGTYEGLCTYNLEQDTLESVAIDYPSPYVMVVREFEPGVLTLGLWDGGILELDMSFNRLSHTEFLDNRVYAVEKTEDDTLWVGTWGGGLFAKRGPKIHNYTSTDTDDGIGHPIIYALMEDATGILWVGTNGSGAYFANPQGQNYLAFSHDMADPDSLDEGKINTIYRDSQDRLWIAVYNQGLNRYENTLDKMVKYKAENETTLKMGNNQVMDIIEYQGRLLIASGAGVEQYREAGDGFERLPILPENTITYALEVDRDNHLWVGTYLDGIYEFDADYQLINHFHVKSTPLAISDNLVYDIVCDQKGNLWIGTNNGLDVYLKEEKEMLAYLKKDGDTTSLPNNTIRTLLETESGEIWVGMVGGGLSKYLQDQNIFTTYTESEGLSDNTVISIEESNGGLIWIATHNGISVLDPDTDHIVNLTASDGIGGYTFSGDGFKDSDGSLFFVGTHGVTHFPPVSKLMNRPLPPVYITDFRVMQKPVSDHLVIYNDLTYTFDSESNFMSFEFNAIDYEYLSHTQYHYRLIGVDAEWVTSGQRNYVSYSNLSPGDYIFEVRAKTIQGLYTDPVRVSFVILKPWHQTTFAYGVYGLILIFIIFSFVKIRENHLITEKNSELNLLNDKLEVAVKDLEEVSIKDGLTGIYNRRYFNTVLGEQFNIAKRSRLPISVLMIDVDDFKEINDAYGHVFGDKYLIAFANEIEKSLVRTTDFCARFGGDEFAVVLYDTDLKGTESVAHTIRRNVGDLKIEHQGENYEMTSKVCIGGYTIIPDYEMSLELLISTADDALYEAKRNGKNQILIKS